MKRLDVSSVREVHTPASSNTRFVIGSAELAVGQPE